MIARWPRGFLIPLCLLGASCGSTTKAVSGPFAACTEAAIADVVAAIEQNAGTLEADLTNYGITLGVEAVICAIDAAEAVFKAKAGAGSAVSAHAVPAGLVVARKWAAEHRTAK